MTRLKSPAEIIPVFATSTARPVMPPNVKLFVNLKNRCRLREERAESQHEKILETAFHIGLLFSRSMRQSNDSLSIKREIFFP